MSRWFKISWFVLLLVLRNNTRAQLAEFNPYQFPSHIPSDYVTDPLSNYEKLLREDMPNCSQRDREIWSEMVSFGEYHTLTSGFVYLGWDQVETYLNNIKNKVLPDSVDKDKFRVFINYDTDLNAFTVPSGNIYFNIGMLAQLQNEAQIAFIMAHEISHYLHRDAKERFLKAIAIEHKGSRADKENISIISAKFSRENESRADNEGFEMASKAGYDVTDMAYALQSLLLNQEYVEKISEQRKRIANIDQSGNIRKRTIDVLLSSHPDINERVKKIKDLSKNHKQDENVSSFPQGEAEFAKFHAQIRLEKMFILYQFNNNWGCLKNAFRYHLLDPENKLYIYFALESIRRILYLDPNYINEGFLTEQFPEYFEEGQGILSNINYLFLDSTNIKKLKATELLNNTDNLINNYGDALTYFKKKCMEHRVTEGYLSMALMYLEDEEKKAFFLDKYLAEPVVYYRNFAEQLKGNNLIQSITNNSRELVLMEEISLFEERSYGYHLRLKKGYEEEGEYYDEIKAFYADYFPNVEFIPMSNYRNESYAEYRKLDNVIRAARRFLFYTEELEKDEIRNAEITEGVNIDGSETFVFGDDDEEPLVITGKDKRKYKKELKSKEYNDEPSKPQELGNQEIDDVTKHNIYVYAPYAWNYFEEHDIVKVEYLELISHRNVTFSNVANNLFFGEKYDHSKFKLRFYTADARLKKADFRYVFRVKEATPFSVVKEINNYYAPD